MYTLNLKKAFPLTQGNLRLLRTIEGRVRYSRFGYAMANLGDINGDGFDGKYALSDSPPPPPNSVLPFLLLPTIISWCGPVKDLVINFDKLTVHTCIYVASQLIPHSDVAISAPFTETGTSEPGTVFIYHSTPTLLLTLQPQQVREYHSLGR